MPAQRGCFFNSCLFLVIVFLPLIGQLIETVMVFQDGHTPLATVIWLLVIWLLPFIGPFLYLLFGQNSDQRGRVMIGRASL